MYTFPETEKGLKNKISRLKSALKKEKVTYGSINDGAGKRYLMFALLYLLGDTAKSEAYFAWYEREFADDVGEPIQLLCWALSLFKQKQQAAAERKLAETMLANLYLLPMLIGEQTQPYDMWHGSNLSEITYVDYVPLQITDHMSEAETHWIKHCYYSKAFTAIRKRYIEIFHALAHTKEMETRKTLLDESYALLTTHLKTQRLTT